MNIFVTNPDPHKAATELPDKHVVKMPLETCQMLSIIYSKWYYDWGNDLLPKKDGTPYNTEKGAFRGHPCTIWAAENIYNNVTTDNLNTIDSWSAKTTDGALVTSFADDLVNISADKLIYIDVAENDSVLYASASIKDEVTNINAEGLVANVDKASVIATEATLSDAIAYINDDVSSVASVAGTFELSAATILEVTGKDITVMEAKATMAATNAPQSSSLNVFDEADYVLEGVEESLVSTLGSVHANNADLDQAIELSATGYVNTITFDFSQEFNDLSVFEASVATSDKIQPAIASYNIVDSLPNITVAPAELLENATSYEVDSSIIGKLTVSEAVTYFEHSNYESPTEQGPDFVVEEIVSQI